MDTTSEIMMRLLEDLYDDQNRNEVNAPYSDYYDSLDKSQSKSVVSLALNKIIHQNGDVICQFNEDDFVLSVKN